MKILVTGCAGFIGFHLAKRMLQAGHEVFGIDNMNAYYDPALKFARLAKLRESSRITSFHFIQMDIEDSDRINHLFDANHFDIVCHLAAQAGVRYSIENPQQYISTNIQGFFNILEACRAHPNIHFVYASSSSVYGKSKQVPYKEDQSTDQPVSLYAATKKTGELMAYAYSDLYGFRTTGLRFFTVYGPWGRPDMAPYLFTDAIIKGDPITLFNDGQMSRDFTYIDDIINGTMQVIQSKSSSVRADVYNIGHSSPVHLLDFISMIEQITGIKAKTINKPMQAGDVETTWADVNHLRDEYNYQPKTSLKDGLSHFIEWYKNYYSVSKVSKFQPLYFHFFS